MLCILDSSLSFTSSNRSEDASMKPRHLLMYFFLFSLTLSSDFLFLSTLSSESASSDSASSDSAFSDLPKYFSLRRTAPKNVLASRYDKPSRNTLFVKSLVETETKLPSASVVSFMSTVMTNLYFSNPPAPL